MSNPNRFRIGQGYDVHRLVDGRKLILGGIEIPHNKGVLGHSDGDVLIHAICDALLGAANLRDIGFHFSDKDAAYKDIDSKILLRDVVAKIHEKGYAIGNIDSTIVLQSPKISGYIPQMKSTLAAVLNVDEDTISIKVTTSERMGFEGREEGVSAQAIALIIENK
ncbi:MAG: 2-C-methyl-D-erythritol 2,4-cyclodiphosphate synthase [Bacteroidales bacterium]|jgi:2-C-methyl-D-erythritol 2,4-cyclodiphosphate synthase|nr:2-C-methyl-D-erythritol 2,4-cyclodiphosphate synthase [Bacteroidales bacterium]